MHLKVINNINNIINFINIYFFKCLRKKTEEYKNCVTDPIYEIDFQSGSRVSKDV